MTSGPVLYYLQISGDVYVICFIIPRLFLTLFGNFKFFIVFGGDTIATHTELFETLLTLLQHFKLHMINISALHS